MDDHDVVRSGIKELLEQNHFLCDEAANGDEAIGKFGESRPDIVILDVTMPRRGGIATAHAIRDVSPRTKIVFYTMHDGERMADLAKLAGADAFIAKGQPTTDLIRVVQDLVDVETRRV